MESPSLGIPRTPNRATSEGPSPPPRNSMEDADSSVTRKRPRLDSGDRAYRSMSADGALSTPPRPEPTEKLPDSSSTEDQLLANHAVTLPKHPLNGAASKVTINVRDPHLTSSPIQPDMQDLPEKAPNGCPEPLIQADASSPPFVTAVSTSPPCSPEIQVAELEDIDGHTGPTVWRAADDSISFEDIQNNLLDEFPMVDRHNDVMFAVNYIHNHVNTGDLGDGRLLRQIALWIDDYLEQTKYYSQHWFNMFTEVREFWEKIPLITHQFIRRSVKFDDQFVRHADVEDGPDNRQYILDFLSAYVALTARMLQIDCQTLHENAEDTVATPDLVSQSYLQVFSCLFWHLRDVTLWKMLHANYAYPVYPAIHSLVLRFTQDPSNGLQCLTNYVDLLLDRSQSQGTLVADVWTPINVVTRLTTYLPKGRVSSMTSGTSTITAEAFQFFQNIETKLQTFITKQVSALSLDLTKSFIMELSTILRNVTLSDESLVAAMTPTDFDFPSDASHDERVLFVEHRWKFNLCKRCITQGRMEIRVQGVETMQEDLVNVYQRWIGESNIERLHMIPKYLSDSILRHKLVDYIVSVESHPQLITRSKNIVGFLVVTGRYTNAETDLIWRTISLSQDSRTIDAVLEMLSGILNIMRDYTPLLYFYQKLIELPIRYFEGKMIIHSKLLREVFVRKWLDKEGRYGPKLLMLPYHLYLRLIREAIADASLSPHRKREIYQFALEELRCVTELGPNDQDTATIYNECLLDISNRTPFASGSMAALNVFLDRNTDEKTEHLAKMSNFIPHLVEEFSSFAGSEAARGAEQTKDALAIRLALLQKIIIWVPGKISIELAEKLWFSMVGEQALGDYARDNAWQTLANACAQSHAPNPFLDICIKKHLPDLHPRFLTWGVLYFAEKVVHYESKPILSASGEWAKRGLPGVELLWHVCLAVPDPAIGSKAVSMLVKAYLDDFISHRNRGSVNEGSHEAQLVDRCILQLNRAASKLKRLNDGSMSSEDDSMVIVPSDQDVLVEKTCFTRSLSILKDFMQGIRSQLPDSPASLAKSQSPYSIHGETMSLKFQIYTNGSSTVIRRIEMGDLSTFGELVERLIKLSGFSKLSFIIAGGRIDYTQWKDKTLGELKLDQKGLIIVQKAPGADLVRQEQVASGLRPLEVEVMKHFHELYELLEMDEQLGKEVFEFLGTFPPHEDITNLVSKKGASTALSFPTDAPYKTLYSVYALRNYLSQNLKDGTISHDIIRHGVCSTVDALLAMPLSSSSCISRTEIIIAASLVECLLVFLKEPVPPEVSASYTDNPSALINRLRDLITAAKVSPETPQTNSLVQLCFSTILEASLYSKEGWEYFKTDPSFQQLIKSLLLESRNAKLREGIATSIRSVCGSLPSTINERDTQDFVSFFWRTFVFLIQEAARLGRQTEQFFGIALEVFRSVNEEAQTELPLESYVKDWSKLLLDHRHDEFVGRESIDWVVYGITRLLDWSIGLMRSKKRPLNIDATLVENIFRTHLFPEIHSLTESTALTPYVPVLDSSTRGHLYSVLLALSTDPEGYRKLLSLVKDLLPQGEDSNAWQWGVAQILEDFHFEPNWNFERMKSIRAPTGYPGIRNLSNTCYLNSLFTQLFMNIGFRGFMLNTNIADGEASQKLLSETQKLFANMQESWLRCVDPQGIAESVITYDNSPIDVSIQMDVDEFYNLLFDRWESQIPSAVDKRTFRQFYGGQIVQQIKSKQCPHMSERLEPFSAIQCEIQNKANLAESLQAYVEGEVMEGDNKYSCSSCGNYVDAVKRACLKDIPDNLIFHLKRFDYDLCTGTRSKINDHFEFPEEIDMAPYDVEYLKDPEQPLIADKFTLVGVLVHSGNAESGHYYSYIRERPADRREAGSWVEFNDSDVTKFDPNNIPDQCFGGLSEPVVCSPMRFHKTWNAYMLFYQRTTAMEAECKSHLPMAAGAPVKEHIPLPLKNRTVIENELFIRRFCLFDPEHVKFIKSLLEHHPALKKGLCSEDHGLEKDIIWLTLDHLDQVFSKTKDAPKFHTIIEMVIKISNSCSECCKLSLDWVPHHEHALRNLLLRCPDELIRKKFAEFMLGGLKTLRSTDARLYGIDVDGHDQENTHEISGHDKIMGAIQEILRSLKHLVQFMHLHFRAWDDYYGVFFEIANFGRPECATLHQEGFLQQCLEVFVIDYNGHPQIKRLRQETPHYMHYYRMLEKGRKFSFHHLLAFFATLLNSTELRHPGSLESFSYSLTPIEHAILRFGPDVNRLKPLVFLDKIIQCDHNPAAVASIVKTLTAAEPFLQTSDLIGRTILLGISIDPASGARPYLQAALAFCETCRSGSQAKNLVTSIAHEVETIGNSGGEDHLDFFVKARRIRNERLSRQDPTWFHNLVLKLVPRWAPTLLLYPDASVRQNTIELLHNLVFVHNIQEMDDEQQAEDIQATAKDLWRACIKRLTDVVILPSKPIDSRQVDDVVRVIRYCAVHYFGEEEDEEFIAANDESESVIDALQALTVSGPDDVLSGEYDSEEILTDYSNGDA